MAPASRSTRANRRSPPTTFPPTGKTWIQLKNGRESAPPSLTKPHPAKTGTFLEEIPSNWGFFPRELAKFAACSDCSEFADYSKPNRDVGPRASRFSLSRASIPRKGAVLDAQNAS
jgi:hypothetical protein